ncbi:MAG: hypothetical protein PHX70_10565 [Clostridium sp.]|nr:hypothetical protein [Clostridium sp.]
MDNDLVMKKVVTSIYKNIKFKIQYHDMKVLNEDAGNNLVKKLLDKDKAVMISRYGAVEMRAIDFYINKKPYNKKIIEDIQTCAGVYPTDRNNLDKFCEFYIECSSKSDALALWQVKNEKKIINKYCSSAKYIKLRSLEPYYFKNPWSKVLENKKVLVVHPFSHSILNQYKKREFLFKNNDILPKFKDIYVVKAIQSNAGADIKYKSWFDSYNVMCDQINKYDFDVAIIGAGAYGLPLASYVKDLGKKAIQMSGATQILFGIKGSRWDKHKVISKLYNKQWIRPSVDETPQGFKTVEGGSYW